MNKTQRDDLKSEIKTEIRAELRAEFSFESKKHLCPTCKHCFTKKFQARDAEESEDSVCTALVNHYTTISNGFWHKVTDCTSYNIK